MLFPDLLVTNIVIPLLQTVPLKLPAFRGSIDRIGVIRGVASSGQDPSSTLAGSPVRDVE